ncbi:MAG: hypothetical protein HYX55_08760 [Chloroflexi bacterium]|nr:hypothetical protein [Chloroflexota bacterium]
MASAFASPETLWILAGRARTVGEAASARLATVPGVFLVALALAVARRPETITNPTFFNEDGQVFYLGAWFSSPWTPYAGYLHLVPRLVAYIERAVPVELAPLVGNTVALLVMAAVAAFFVSEELPGDRRLRAVLGLFVVLSPLSAEVAGSLTYVQWYLAIFLGAFIFSIAPRRRWLPPLVVAGLTGPFSLILAPIFVARGWRDVAFRPFAYAIAATGAIQLVALTISQRFLQSPLGDIPNDIALRLVVAPVIGQTLSEPLRDHALLPGLVLLVPVLVAVRQVPRRVAAVAGYAIAALAIIGLFLRSDGGPLTDLTSGAARYFFIPATALGMVAIIGAWRGRRAASAIALACILIGVVLSFRMLPHVLHPDWALRWPAPGEPYEPWNAMP